MTLKTIIFSLFISSILLYSSCILNTWDTRLSIDNRTDDLVYYEYEISSLKDSSMDLKYCKTTGMYYIPPHSNSIIHSLYNWESLRKENSVLHIYIYNVDTVNSVGVCRAWNENKYLKRYTLTYDDLIKLNWRVVFPSNSINAQPSPNYPTQYTDSAIIAKWENLADLKKQHPTSCSAYEDSIQEMTRRKN